MKPLEKLPVQAGHGNFLKVAKGETVRVIAPDGSQVCDFWAFVDGDSNEFLSAEHTRSTLEKLVPQPGDQLLSNRRHVLLTVTEDTSAGRHDMLMSACDPRRYELLGHDGYHRSCAENLCLAMEAAGETAHELPSPFNIFQNVTVSESGRLQIVPPVVEPGQYLAMKAEADLLVVVSACPMDIAKTNGPNGDIRPILLERYG